MRLIPIVLATTAFLVRSGPADACSLASCLGGHFTPGDKAVVPANLPALHWQPMRGAEAADPAKVTLTTAVNPDVELAFSTTMTSQGYLLTPDQPLVAGTSYILTDRNTCLRESGPRVVFTVGPAAPIPAKIGTLTSIPRGVASLDVESDAPCTATVDAAQATIDLEVEPDAAPWLDVLHFTTLVDDQLWLPTASSGQNLAPGTSWRGRGTDLVYRVCTEAQFVDPGLDAGKHVVTLSATLPGSVTLTSPSTVVDLACPADRSGCSTGSSSSSGLLLALAAILARKRCRDGALFLRQRSSALHHRK